MAIRIITGVPRAGKTYFAVNHLVQNYYKKVSDTYVLNKDVCVITNIDSLKLESINFDDYLRQNNLSFEQFFNNSYQKEFTKKYKNVIYIIDEAQQYIRTKFNDNEVFMYFEYHGHYGHDIYLITHSVDKLTKQITSLMEYEIRAVKRSFSLMGEFKYNIRSEKEIFKRMVLKPSKEIYDLYRSQFAEESEKVKNPIFKTLIILIIVFIGCGILAYKLLFSHKNVKQYKDFVQEKNLISKKVSYQLPQKPTPPAQTFQVITERVRLDWAQIGKDIYIVDPVIDQLVSLKHFKRYPIQVIFNRSSTEFYAFVKKIQTSENNDDGYMISLTQLNRIQSKKALDGPAPSREREPEPAPERERKNFVDIENARSVLRNTQPEQIGTNG